MLTNVADTARPWIFYALTLGMATAIATAPGATTAVTAFTPLVATVLMLLLVTREGWTTAGWASLGLHRLGLRAWGVALAVPIVVVGVAHGLLWLSPLATVGPSAATRGAGLEMLPVLIAGNIVFAALTTVLAEEVGWRGYLLPRLTYLGTRRAMVVTGILHGMWHLPIMLLTDLYHPFGSRWIVVPLFLISATSAGVFMGWLRLRTGSVWPAVLAHASHNAAFAWFTAYTIGDATVHEYLAGESGALTALAYVVLALWLLTRRPLHDLAGGTVADITAVTVPPSPAPAGAGSSSAVRAVVARRAR